MADARIPVDTLHYPTIVTRDAKALALNHARFFGIDRWNVSHFTPERLTNTSLRGRGRGEPPRLELIGHNRAPGEYGFLSALGSNEDGTLTFQIVQPMGGLSTFEHFLVTRGTGVHGLFMSVLGRDGFTTLRHALGSENIPVAQSFTADGAADFYYFDTRSVLGGFYVQVVVPRRADWQEALRVDERWDFSGEYDRPPAARAAARTTALPHFGVVVHDTERTVANFARLFGQPVWRGMNWRTEEGSLEDTTNNGRPVKHAYFTARADIGKSKAGIGFGFEVIQPTFGASHYKEDFLQVLGPGIHHIDTFFPVADWNEWDALNRWMADEFGSPTCMSGWLRGRSALFQYQDTREKLGYVIEIHAPHPKDKPRTRSAPDYWFDFSTECVA
jgi:hypothetical protein